MTARLTLEPGEWYGMTMWPGYSDQPYHSPIQVRAVRPIAGIQRAFEIDFLNAAYAAGVQDMRCQLQTLVREERYLLAKAAGTDRAVAIVPLSEAWFNSHLPRQLETWRELASATKDDV